MKDTNNRIEWVDIAKGIGIMLVIAGHAFSMDIIYPVYAFHLPLFFFLSGLVNNESKITSDFILLFKKVHTILKPWAVFWCVSLFVCLIVPQWRNNLSGKTILYEFYTANTNNVQNSSIWFLLCMFVMMCLYALVRHIPRNKVSVTCMGLAAISILWIKQLIEYIFGTILHLPDGRMPFKMDSSFIALVFFCVATWNREWIIKRIRSTKYNPTLIFCFVLMTIAAACFNGTSNLNAYAFGNNVLLYYPIAFFGIFTCMIVSQKISTIQYPWLRSLLRFYGINSLLIFGFQSLYIRLYLLLFNYLQGFDMQLYCNNPMYHQVGSFLVVTFVLSPLTVYVILQLRKRGITIL